MRTSSSIHSRARGRTRISTLSGNCSLKWRFVIIINQSINHDSSLLVIGLCLLVSGLFRDEDYGIWMSSPQWGPEAELPWKAASQKTDVWGLRLTLPQILHILLNFMHFWLPRKGRVLHSVLLMVIKWLCVCVMISYLIDVVCCVSAAGVHLRSSGVGFAGRTDSRERRQQRHQLQSPQTAHCLRDHVVAWRSAWTQRATQGGRGVALVRADL